jgi:filamentous hemagglutinin family protein
MPRPVSVISPEKQYLMFFSSHRLGRTGCFFRIAVSSVLFLQLAAPARLSANPQGGNVVAGQATISGGAGTLTIHQASQRAIINWQDFSIQQGELTKFVQPNAASAVLNRVVGSNLSGIYGTLEANGQVFLINPNGIVIGPGGVVNTRGFLASTHDVENHQFLAGGDFTFKGESKASVVNLGKIGASEGDVILIAQEVENRGEIKAPNGTVGFAAGHEVLVKASGQERIFVQAGKGRVSNHSLIESATAELKAAGGNEYALAINNTGVVRATGVVHQGGRILLKGNSGTVRNAGTLSARSGSTVPGAGATKPEVMVLAENMELAETSVIVAPGGFVETSGATLSIAAGARVDTRAEDGTLGNWLIDPVNMEIITGGGVSLTGSTVDPTAVVNALNLSNVTLQADNSITVTNAIDASANTNVGNLAFDTVTLNLNAGISLKAGGVLSGTPTTVNVGAGGLVQNGIDAVAAGGTVNLAATTYNLPGTVNIAKNLTLNGTAGSTVLDANSAFRVVGVSGGTVVIDGLTLREGSAVSGGGLALFGSANVTLRNSTVTANRATNTSGSGFFGGGILTESSTTTLMIERSTVSNNTARFGAGIDLYGTLTFTDSTLSGNVASGSGGGLYLNPGSTATFTNSTVANNRAAGIGAGLDSDGGNLTVTHSTIVGNVSATAGGIYSSGNLTIGHTIVAGNTASSGPDIRVAGGTSTSQGYNLVGSVLGFTPNGTTDISYTGTLANLVHTNAGAPVLTDNGGPTQTVALVFGSAAYLAGGTNPGGLLDQRGLLRGSTISIGAYDANPTTLSRVVTTADDNNAVGSTKNSLRSAILAVNNGLGIGFAITFDDTGVFSTPQTITLSPTLGQLLITSSQAILGPVAGVTIDANASASSLRRVMQIQGGSAITVELNALNLTGGYIDSSIPGGAGLYAGSGATVTLRNSAVYNNTSLAWKGGGIMMENSGPLTIIKSTIAGNIATDGAGIFQNDSGLLTIETSTISGNQANAGGGIYSSNSQIAIRGTILAGNTATVGPDLNALAGSVLTSQGYNLYGTNLASGTGSAVNFNGTGDIALGSTPITSVLNPVAADNGGPTRTVALVLGSVAIDAGDPSLNGSLDQRGVERGDGQFTGARADIGAYEAQIIRVTADDQTITYGDSVPTLTFTVTNGTATGLLSGDLAVVSPSVNAGSYAIGQGTLTPATNYLLAMTNGTLTIDPLAISVSTTDVDRAYDGTTDAAGTAVLTGGSLVFGNTLGAGTFTFDDRNVGTGKTVTVNSVVINDGNNGDNYIVTLVDNTNSSISVADVTVTAQTDSRSYDGTTDSSVAPLFTGTIFGPDSVGTAPTQSFDNRNVGTGKTLTASGLVIDDGNGGNNYNIIYVDDTTGVITAADVTVTAQTDSRGYDGTTDSSVAPLLTGTIFGPDSVGTAATQSFDNRNAGTGKTLTASGLVIDDGNSGNNYNIIYVDDTTGVITAADLTVTAQTDSRGYDGTADSSVAPLLTGTIFGPDSVGTAATQAFDNRNVGTGKTLTASGLVIDDGNGGNNYNIIYVDDTTGVISVADVTVRAQTDSRSYDGTTDSSVAPLLTGTIFSPDSIGTAATQSFDNRNAGTGKTLTASGLVIDDGNSGNNYNILYVDATTGEITRAPLTVTAQTDRRVFDDTVNSSVLPLVTGTLFAPDTVDTPATQVFDTKDVGTGKTLIASGLVINDGNSGNNYTITYVDDTTGVIDRVANVLTTGSFFIAADAGRNEVYRISLFNGRGLPKIFYGAVGTRIQQSMVHLWSGDVEEETR